MKTRQDRIVIIGGGFTGLTAAFNLAKQSKEVIVIEKQEQLGGLASAFEINGVKLEKFYHHCFNSDTDIISLAKDLDCEDKFQWNRGKTSIYVNGKFYSLSTPLDVLNFKPLSLTDRIRLGLLVLKARRVKDWKSLECMTAEQWLIKLSGRQVYQVVWEPLLRGKFGDFASRISAVWFWNKLVLRGGTRSKTGREILGYYNGSFSSLADRIADKAKSFGAVSNTRVTAQKIISENGTIKGVQTNKGFIDAIIVIATPALPIIAELLEDNAPENYLKNLRKIKYLANVCLVLELKNKLSDTYWLNVADKEYPYVGVIEHTNFQSAEIYRGKHIVYLSKYLQSDAELYLMNSKQIYEYSIPHIKKIFPEFNPGLVDKFYVWKAKYAQPVVECHYSSFIPSRKSPLAGLYLASMAQIYPQDRGVNYSIRQGRDIAQFVMEDAKL